MVRHGASSGAGGFYPLTFCEQVIFLAFVKQFVVCSPPLSCVPPPHTLFGTAVPDGRHVMDISRLSVYSLGIFYSLSDRSVTKVVVILRKPLKWVLKSGYSVKSAKLKTVMVR